MKKIYFGVISLVAVLLITGCGSSNKVVCTASIDEQGQKYDAEMTAKFDENDKIENVSFTMTFTTEEEAKLIYRQYEEMMRLAEQFAQQGQQVPQFEIKNDGKKITIGDYAAFVKLAYEGMEQPGAQEDAPKREPKDELMGMNKDTFKKNMESDPEAKWTCK